MGRRRFLAVVPAVVLAGSLFLASGAQAAFHFMKIREVHPGGTSGGSYVVLQMWTGGQNFVAGHDVVVYDATGSASHTFEFSGNVSNGSSQATILVAGEGYATTFPSGPAPDETDSGLDLPAAGGGVCFEAIDCVSWGNFEGSLPSAAGKPASPGGVTAGKALHRSITATCSLLLENGDDSQDSFTDFSEQEPNPRNNDPVESPKLESSCPGPSASIGEKPTNPTGSESASFTYDSPSESANFECWLDGDPFEACPPGGIEYAALAEGGHIFRVRASDETGVGLTASYAWSVDLTPPEVAIDEPKPENGTPGNSVSFFFHATNEAAASFECLLVEGDGEGAESFEKCESGDSHGPLEENGLHTFKVRAVDFAGNTGEPASHSWTVDNEADDTTPPTVTIDSIPPNPSESSTASFTYSANEAPVTFECRLDGGSFSPCSDSGRTYEGLGNGSHTFVVVAIDEALNVSEPAGYTWDVALPPAAEPPPTHLPPLPPEPPPGVLVAAGFVKVQGARVLLRTRCRGLPGTRCRGALRLVVRIRSARSSASRRARNLVIGRARYGLPAGRARVVRVRLTRKGKRLVRSAGRRGLRVRLIGPRVRNRMVVLRPVRRAKRRGGARR